MNLPQERWSRILFCAAFASAACALFSIALSQIALGVSVAAFLIARPKLRWPAWLILLGLFVAWTLLSFAFSPAPLDGLPQIRKLYVLALLPVMLAAFRGVDDFKALAVVWLIAGSAAAARSLWQFAMKWTAALQSGADFYRSYVGDRITGFMSHWMTFSSQMMLVFLVALALLLWDRRDRRILMLSLLALALSGAALVASFTRGVWFAAAAASVFLLVRWKPWAVLALPVGLILILTLGPESVRTRLTSVIRPQGQMDSNQHRVVTWRTGIEMIKRHPLLGVGPEQVGRRFHSYVPADIPRPLPEGWYGHLHNIYLQYAAERGIPAAVFILGMLITLIVLWFRATAGLPAGDPALWALNAGIAVVIGVLVTGIFEHNLGDSEVLALTLATLGATEATRREIRAQ